MTDTFKKLKDINVNEFTNKKGKLTYLSWAHAWSKFKEACPDAKYEIVKNEHNLPMFGNEKLGYMVYTRVTVGEEMHQMWLAVMDNYNKPILSPKMTDINKTLMRCLTKNLAMFGLGLYIYAGEDLPEDEAFQAKEQKHENHSTRGGVTGDDLAEQWDKTQRLQAVSDMMNSLNVVDDLENYRQIRQNAQRLYKNLKHVKDSELMKEIEIAINAKDTDLNYE